MAVFVSAGGSIAQIVRKGSSYTFRAKYAKGRSASYLITTKVTPINPNSGMKKTTLTLPVRMKVLDVKTGVAQIRNEIGPMKVNGKIEQAKRNVVVHVDSLNRLVGVGSAEVPQFSAPMPEKPLKIGQSWSSLVNTAGSTPEAMKVKATYTLRRVSAGKAYLDVKYEGGGSGKPAIHTSGTGQMVLNTADGFLHSMAVNQKVVLSSGNGATTAITVAKTG